MAEGLMARDSRWQPLDGSWAQYYDEEPVRQTQEEGFTGSSLLVDQSELRATNYSSDPCVVALKALYSEMDHMGG